MLPSATPLHRPRRATPQRITVEPMTLPPGVQPRKFEEIDEVLRDRRKEMKQGTSQAAAGAARVAGRPLPAGTIVHEVGPHDTLTSLAVRYVVSHGACRRQSEVCWL